jgi:hypothetical protein
LSGRPSAELFVADEVPPLGLLSRGQANLSEEMVQRRSLALPLNSRRGVWTVWHRSDCTPGDPEDGASSRGRVIGRRTGRSEAGCTPSRSYGAPVGVPSESAPERSTSRRDLIEMGT